MTASTPALTRAALPSFGRPDVAGDEIDPREGALHGEHRLDDRLRVPVRRVHHQHVRPGAHQRLGARLAVGAGADRGPDAQAPQLVLGRVREADGLLDVLDGDQAAELIPLVDHRQLLDPVAVQDLLRLLERHARLRGDELLLGHHLAHGAVETLLEAEIPIGQDADQLAAPGDRQAGDAVLLHDRERLGDRLLGVHGHRVDDHAALGLLHLLDLERLLRDRQVAVDDAEAALLRHRDRGPRLGDGVHGGAEQRDVEPDRARERGGDVGVARQDARGGGDEQHVVEGEALAQLRRQHAASSKSAKGPTRCRG